MKTHPVKRINHIELLAGNALQSSYFYRKVLGFSLVAYLGPETGYPDRVSYVLRQGRITFVLTTPLSYSDPHNLLLTLHGDAARDICFEVDNVDHVFQETVKRGAHPAVEPHDLEDIGGRVRRAAIRTCGDVIHSFISTRAYNGHFLPNFEELDVTEEPVGFTRIDHVAASVEERQMDRWCDYYRDVLGFHQFVSYDDSDTSTEFTALRSKVMANDSRNVKFSINEPAPGKCRSQIQEFLDFNYSAGIQHIALHTRDIIETVGNLRDNGLVFQTIPEPYYETVWDRVGAIEEDRDLIRQYNILVDRDEKGYLLQAFSKPVQDRPTLIFEVIQRNGCEGFGKGNFKALFESLALERIRRGTL